MLYLGGFVVGLTRTFDIHEEAVWALDKPFKLVLPFFVLRRWIKKVFCELKRINVYACIRTRVPSLCSKDMHGLHCRRDSTVVIDARTKSGTTPPNSPA